MPKATAYAGEVLRQIGILAGGSTLVVMFSTLMVGQSCGLESSYLARALAAPHDRAGRNVGCAVLYVVPFLFGFILAAKVGCGFVAEIGAMRVSEEVDALDVMGIDSMVFIVSARLLAGTLFLPVMYLLALGASDLGGFLQSGVRFHQISLGTYNTYQYSFFGPVDLLISFAQGLTISAVVMTVALYYGYNVRGGPVEVGVDGEVDVGQPRARHLGEPRVRDPVHAEAADPDRMKRGLQQMRGRAAAVVAALVLSSRSSWH